MSKKIWIDMTNSPHVLFFEPLIKILKKKAMKSDLKMKIEPARSFDYPIFVYDISRARTLLLCPIMVCLHVFFTIV